MKAGCQVEYGGDDGQPSPCCVAFPPSHLSEMLFMQDEHMPWGSQSNANTASFNSAVRYFNEIVLDKSTRPWLDADLKRMVQAVFIAPTASTEAQEFGRSVHGALLAKLGLDSMELPFVFYDPSANDLPFSVEK